MGMDKIGLRLDGFEEGSNSRRLEIAGVQIPDFLKKSGIWECSTAYLYNPFKLVKSTAHSLAEILYH